MNELWHQKVNQKTEEQDSAHDKVLKISKTI